MPEKSDEGVQAEAAAEKPVETAATAQTVPVVSPQEQPAIPQAPSARFRPARALFYIAAALIPALAVYFVMSYRNVATQRMSLGELEHSLSRMEQRISQLQAREAAAVVLPAPARSEPGTYLSLLSEANLHFRDSNFENAARSYRAAIAMDAGGTMCDEAHYQLGLCLVKENAQDPALQEFLTVVRTFPGSGFYARACLEAARICLERGQHSQARRLLYMAIGARERLTAMELPALEKAHFLLAKCYEDEAAAVEAARPAPHADFAFDISGETP